MPHGGLKYGMLHLLSLASLVTTALAAAAPASQFTCAPLSLDSRGAGHIFDRGLQASRPVFPTDNRVRSVTGRELHELSSSEYGGSSKQGRKGGLVVLFYLAGDPPSV